MDKLATPTPSSCQVRPAHAPSLENGLLSASYEKNCPYRSRECGEDGLDLKFRLVEILDPEGICYTGDSFGDRQYIDTDDPRPCSHRCLCQFHDRTESHFVFLAQKTKNTFDLIIYDATLYLRLAGALGWDIVGDDFGQGGFVVNGFALLRNCEALMQDLALVQREAEVPSDTYLVSSMRLLLDGFLGDEEVFRSFGHTFLHEQQHIGFDHWKKFQASRAVKDIMLLNHGFHEAELDRVPRPYGNEDNCEFEHDDTPPGSWPFLTRSSSDYHTVQPEKARLLRAQPASTLGSAEDSRPRANYADSTVTPTMEVSMSAEDVEIINLVNTLIDQDPFDSSLSPKELLEQLPGPKSAGVSTSSQQFPEIETASHVHLDVPHEELRAQSYYDSFLDEPNRERDFHIELHDALRLESLHQVHEALALLQHRGRDRLFSVLLSSIQRAAELGRSDILTLFLDPSFFDPSMGPATAAVQVERALQITMRNNFQETGEMLLAYYLRHELYDWGSIGRVVIEAARHGCHWILRSTIHRATIKPLYLAYQAAKYAAGEPLQRTLQLLSSLEPGVFRLCVEHAAKVADNRAVRALLGAAQGSKDLQHATIIWEAAMTGDAQVLWFVFGPCARKAVLILLQEAGNLRVRQVHEIFTKRYPCLLMNLRKASCHFSINVEGLMCRREDWKTSNSLFGWDRGNRALKGLIQGNVPFSFPDMLLVLSIAKAVSTTMDSTYTPSKSWTGAFLQDLPRWQALLPVSQHAAYAYCVRGLWGVELDKSLSPEPLSHPDLLERFQGLAICLIRDATDVLGLNENVSGKSLHSSQRRRAYRNPIHGASDESTPLLSPHHEGPTGRFESQNDHMRRQIVPESGEGAPLRSQTWQAITESLRYSIPESKVPSIFIMMGTVFFCILQFTFFLRLCQAAFPDMIHNSASAYTSAFGPNLFHEPLERLADKCDFLEVYFDLHEQPIADERLLKPGLMLSAYTLASSKGQDVSSKELLVNHDRTLGGARTTTRSQSNSDSCSPDDEHGSTPFSTFSARSNSEPGSVAKSIYSCTTCGIPFPTSSNFHRHMREKHKKTRFTCENCDKGFSRADYVKKHRCRGKMSSARARAVKPKII